MRLAVRCGQPPSVVMGWPVSDIHLLGEFVALEPPPTERLEYLLAHVAAGYFNGHREKGKAATPTEKFLLFRNAWRFSDRYSEQDLDILESIDRLG